MELVDRIKTFMDAQQISNSQFADTCNIPRPTVSQILNGRNKKISDEIISKIHYAYPNLSMSWLLFEEGDMLIDPNIKTSGAQNNGFSPSNDADKLENESVMGRLDFDLGSPEPTVKKQERQNHSTMPNNPGMFNVPVTSLVPTKMNEPKKIQRIVVFYNDKSFETFSTSPSTEKNNIDII